jgi:hypothetical protein
MLHEEWKEYHFQVKVRAIENGSVVHPFSQNAMKVFRTPKFNFLKKIKNLEKMTVHVDTAATSKRPMVPTGPIGVPFSSCCLHVFSYLFPYF